MEPVYVELVLNDKLIRINKNDALDIYSWRDCKTKPSYWFKIKPTLKVNKYKYKRYELQIGKYYILSRVVYKAHNPDWDITDTSDTNFVDHKNKNSLDNRIENLRILTHQQNQFNSKAKGYCWCKYNKIWKAEIMANDKRIYLGSFKEEADAKNAYLEAKEKYHIIA